MSLRQLRDGASLAQVGIAVAAVASAGGVRWYSLVAALALSLAAFARPRPRAPSIRAQRMWTAGVFVALIGTIVRAFSQAEFLDAGVDFLLLLIVQRLFARQRSREHMQLLLLGTLMMVVASVISTGLDYPILFVAYLPAAVLALVTNHLMAEGERLGPRVALEVERQGIRAWRTLARAAVTIAALAGLGAVVIFLVFPRFGAGVFLRGSMARDMRSGFAGEVELGGFGRIKDDPTVAMRLHPIDPIPASDRLTWYLRGSSFDVYAHGRWRNGQDGEAIPHAQVRGWSTLAPNEQPLLQGRRSLGPGAGTVGLEPAPGPTFASADQTIRVMVTLEDLGVDVLFVASEPLGAKLRPRGPLEGRAGIRAGRHREFRLDKLPGPMRYEFISRIGVPTDEELSSVGDPDVDPALTSYLVPGEGLSSDVGALARELTHGEPTRHAKVEAVRRHLATFDYSLELRPSERVRAGADPLEGFLFDTRAGHCEYFATAMALLLREIGIPTRIVNGYYGAHRNRLGDFWSVRQADAHSWVEVHFGPLGWVTYDPTPPAGRSAGDDASMWPAAAQVIDAIRHAYLEYVIDYDLGKQLALLDGAGLRRSTGSRPRLAWRPALRYLAIAGVMVLVVLWLRRRQRGSRAPEVRIYERLLRRLARAGHVRRPTESPSAFGRRLTSRGIPCGEPLQQFAARYEALRFGPAGSHRLGQLREAADRVRRACRQTQ